MARPRTFDPRRLDMRAFAEAAAALEGEIPQQALTRLSGGALPVPDQVPEAVRWSASAELRPVTGGAPEVWLHLTAAASVTLECQRCLQPMREPLHVDRWFRFVATEDEAARLDEESEDDVLVLSRSLDLLDLVEDELILALPLVPRHEACPEPLPLGDAPAEEPEEAAPHPFAALEALRRGRRDG